MEWIWNTAGKAPVPKYFYHSPLFPNPITCFTDIITTGSSEFYNRFLPWNGIREWTLSTYEETATLLSYLDLAILILPMIVAVILTLSRIAFNKLNEKLADITGIQGDDKQKVTESAWRILIYSITWTWSVQLLFLDGEDYFFALGKHYKWWYRGVVIPCSPYNLMVLEMGFYLHSIFSTMYLDVPKKDYWALLLHHFLACIIIASAYAIRLHVHALMLIFLMDLGDVLLELSKLLFHCRYRRGRYSKAAAWMANIIFAVFASQFMLFRIYWYPTKVLYSTFHTSIEMYIAPPNYFYLNALMTAVFIMQLYWLKYIARLVWKFLVKGEDPHDVRDVKKTVASPGVHKTCLKALKEE